LLSSACIHFNMEISRSCYTGSVLGRSLAKFLAIGGPFLDRPTAASPHEMTWFHTTLPAAIFRQQSRPFCGEVTCIRGGTNEQRIRGMRAPEQSRFAERALRLGPRLQTCWPACSGISRDVVEIRLVVGEAAEEGLVEEGLVEEGLADVTTEEEERVDSAGWTSKSGVWDRHVSPRVKGRGVRDWHCRRGRPTTCQD
jgi:hypothetical protein